MVFAAPLSFLLALELLFDDRQRGAEVPQEEDHEGEAAHEDLPFLTVWVPSQLKQKKSIIELPKVAKEEERQQEGEASPHPRLEPLHSQVHVVPLPQSSQSVQTATLIVVLQELHKTLV